MPGDHKAALLLLLLLLRPGLVTVTSLALPGASSRPLPPLLLVKTSARFSFFSSSKVKLRFFLHVCASFLPTFSPVPTPLTACWAFYSPPLPSPVVPHLLKLPCSGARERHAHAGWYFQNKILIDAHLSLFFIVLCIYVFVLIRNLVLIIVLALKPYCLKISSFFSLQTSVFSVC